MTPRAIAFALIVLLIACIAGSWDLVRNEWEERPGAAKWFVLAGFLLIFGLSLAWVLTPMVWKIFSP